MEKTDNTIENIEALAPELPEEEAEETAAAPNPLRGVWWPFIAVIVLAAGAFAAFAMLSSRTGLTELLSAGASIIFFAAVLIRALPSLYSFFRSDERPTTSEKIGERSIRRIHPVRGLVIGSLLIQLCAIYAVFAASGFFGRNSGTIFHEYPRLFIGSHGVLFGENTRTIISSLGLLSFVLPDHIERIVAGSGLVYPVFFLNAAVITALTVLIYELLILDHDRKSSIFAATLLLVSPAILLMLQPLSGTSLFIASVLLSFFLLRKRHPVLSGAAAAFGCLFNIFASLMFAPIIIEGVHQAMWAHRRGEKVSGRVVGCVFGALIPIACAAAAFTLWFLGFKGMSAFNGEFRFFFEPLGRLLTAAPFDAALRAVALAAMAFTAIITFISAKRIRFSFTAFSLLYLALAPSILSADLMLYSLFAFPLLAVNSQEVLSRRYLRTVSSFVMAAATALMLIFLFVRR